MDETSAADRSLYDRGLPARCTDGGNAFFSHAHSAGGGGIPHGIPHVRELWRECRMDDRRRRHAHHVNDDDTVNASDAAQILIAAASAGAGGDLGLTEEQTDAADVNGDGTINASDAAIILIYAAAAGAGQEDVKLTDFVK